MEKNKELFNIKSGSIVSGPMFPESVQVIVPIPMGDIIKLVGKGLKLERMKKKRERILADPATYRLEQRMGRIH